jgi:TolB protein
MKYAIPYAWLRSSAFTALLIAASMTPAFAQVTIRITTGVNHPVPIAIVPFAESARDPVDVAKVVAHDLVGSGRFSALASDRMPATPHHAAQVQFGAWKADGIDYLLVGRVVPLSRARLAVDFNLLNVLTRQSVARKRFTGMPQALLNAAHRVSDVVFRAITGIRGAFDTHIAYVAQVGTGAAHRFQLVVADADGYNQHLILQSPLPLMSPVWSPNGKWLAYVSFEDHLSAVYIQRVRTGQRYRVSARPGENGAPAWAPNGQELALTLSGNSGYPQIYVLNMHTRHFTRITDAPAINTSADWAPNGRSIYFTSDRDGSPQIYRIGVTPGSLPVRVTFTDGYNADPRVSPNGRLLAMVTGIDGRFCIAVQNLKTGSFRVLTHGPLDSSPSFAPNGATIIYSRGLLGEKGGSVLAMVSVDGLPGMTLKPTHGQVGNPAWGPFPRRNY